jgi:fatty-acyl-CoA synthase
MRDVLNLGVIHEAIAAIVPEREALVFREHRFTWAQVADRTRRLANLLRAHGLGCRRERSGLAGHMSGQDHVALYLSTGTSTWRGCSARTRRVAPRST